jgi:methionyl-tRNA formyltransferase
MRLAFMGTPEFSATALAELIASGHQIACVYTRAPKPRGRGHAPQQTPVHAFAEAAGFPVRTPTNFKAAEEIERFCALEVDAAAVVAYGLILPAAILDAPKLGCFNLHASILPRWRGAAPVQRAIMAGDDVTGVQVMRMETDLDTGPILLSETVEILQSDTAATLTKRLSHVGASLLARALSAVERGTAVETPQSLQGVTYARKIASNEARIAWEAAASAVDRQIRGLSPHPGAWFEIESERGKERIKALLSQSTAGAGEPGQILDSSGRLIVACGRGAVELLKLQRAGKSVQTSADFLRGFPLKRGDRL